MAETDKTATRDERGGAGSAADEASAARPIYEKPRLRRHDRIDQVKPYGPSEL